MTAVFGAGAAGGGVFMTRLFCRCAPIITNTAAAARRRRNRRSREVGRADCVHCSDCAGRVAGSEQLRPTGPGAGSEPRISEDINSSAVEMRAGRPGPPLCIGSNTSCCQYL